MYKGVGNQTNLLLLTWQWTNLAVESLVLKQGWSHSKKPPQHYTETVVYRKMIPATDVLQNHLHNPREVSGCFVCAGSWYVSESSLPGSSRALRALDYFLRAVHWEHPQWGRVFVEFVQWYLHSTQFRQWKSYSALLCSRKN